MKVWLELENYRFILTSPLGRSGIQEELAWLAEEWPPEISRP